MGGDAVSPARVVRYLRDAKVGDLLVNPTRAVWGDAMNEVSEVLAIERDHRGAVHLTLECRRPPLFYSGRYRSAKATFVDVERADTGETHHWAKPWGTHTWFCPTCGTDAYLCVNALD